MRFRAYYRLGGLDGLPIEADGWPAALVRALKVQSDTTGPLEALEIDDGTMPVDAADRHPS